MGDARARPVDIGHNFEPRSSPRRRGPRRALSDAAIPAYAGMSGINRANFSPQNEEVLCGMNLGTKCRAGWLFTVKCIQTWKADLARAWTPKKSFAHEPGRDGCGCTGAVCRCRGDRETVADHRL